MSSSQYCNMLIAIYPFVMVLGVLASGRDMDQSTEGHLKCKEGYFYHNPGCYQCSIQCRLGMVLVKPCHPKHDIICRCPNGKYWDRARGGTGKCKDHITSSNKAIDGDAPPTPSPLTTTSYLTTPNHLTTLIHLTTPSHLTTPTKETNISIGGNKTNNSETDRPTGEMVQNILITIVVTVIVTLVIVFVVNWLNKKYGLWGKLKQNCQCRSQGGDIENQDGDVSKIENEEDIHLDKDKQSAYFGENILPIETDIDPLLEFSQLKNKL